MHENVCGGAVNTAIAYAIVGCQCKPLCSNAQGSSGKALLTNQHVNHAPHSDESNVDIHAASKLQIILGDSADGVLLINTPLISSGHLSVQTSQEAMLAQGTLNCELGVSVLWTTR